MACKSGFIAEEMLIQWIENKQDINNITNGNCMTNIDFDKKNKERLSKIIIPRINNWDDTVISQLIQFNNCAKEDVDR